MSEIRSAPRFVAVPILLAAAVALVAVPALAQMTSVGIDCSQVNSLRLLKQDNMRAGQALIECGIVKGGSGGGAAGEDEDALAPAPPNILVSNRTCASSSSCTKSESFVWAKPDGMTLVANYNDHNQSQYSGTSYSTNGGATFTEILPPPFGTGHGTNYGDPIVVYNVKLGKWFGGDLVSGCGGQGIGVWSSTDAIHWTTGACVHNNSADDRESMWVDNDPSSPAYGRMYISWNDFNVGGGALVISHSDNGTTWTGETILDNGLSTFMRDVQVTGTPPYTPKPNNSSVYSTVFVASMDEGGGGLNTRQNVIFRSTNGGVSWTKIVMGARFSAVGDGTCASNSYFAEVSPIWRHMGWGEPAVGPLGVVHYVFAGAGTGADHGDIYYTRSTDNGSTWSAPIKLNTDTDAQYKTQWMPSLSVTNTGKVTASWYDRRQATTACNVATDPGCSYNRYARQSSNNGASWSPDFAVSTTLIPQPQQLDSGVQSCYAGDYDYNTANLSSAYVTWTDGRRIVGGVSVQDVNFASVPEP